MQSLGGIVLGGRILYRRLISAVRDLWSAICVAASTLGYLYLENVPFAIFLPLYGPCLLYAYSFLCMVSCGDVPHGLFCAHLPAVFDFFF